MALVLPILRLWVLLLNLYGTFKAIKPPRASQRPTRNGQGSSARLMQLRKRELKSSLIVWIVWAFFCSLEFPLDHTIGLVTPFYHELKCTVLIFLLLSRSHGAEAIFLHLIHPFVRPYVPAVDKILATFHSVFELLTLLLIFPWEYITDCYSRWKWSWPWRKTAEPGDDAADSIPSFTETKTKEQSDMRRRLRPRNKPERASLLQANMQAQTVFEEINEAQNQVRTRSRTQLAPRNEPQVRVDRGSGDTAPGGVGSKTRRRRQDQQEGLSNAVDLPGSSTTGLHHLDPSTIAQLTNGPSFSATTSNLPRQSPGPIAQRSLHSRKEETAPTTPSSYSGYEIWHPPKSSFDDREQQPAFPSYDLSREAPSPVYPPFPSAYHFTPPPSDNLPLRPRTVTPQETVMPTPHQPSRNTVRRRGVYTHEDANELFPGDTAALNSSSHQRPSSYTPGVISSASDHLELKDFFQKALEPSIQTTDMDVDTETLSTGDGSSASEKSMREDSKNMPVQRRPNVDNNASIADTDTVKDKHEISENNKNAAVFRGNKRKAIASTSERRSIRIPRTGNDESLPVQRDEFGFSIPSSTAVIPDGSITEPAALSTSTLRKSPGLTTTKQKKPLARTKPALKPTLEEADSYVDTSDEESIRKKRKVKRAGTKGNEESANSVSVPTKPAPLNKNASKTAAAKTGRKAKVSTVKREMAAPASPKGTHAGHTGARTSLRATATKQPSSTHPGGTRRNKAMEMK